MEGRPEGAPLKVCPHCSVASRTDAETCPSCGGSYLRGAVRWRWSWWFAIPIVAAAFLVGYFGLGELIEGDDADGEAGTIALEQATAVPSGISREELEGRLGEEPALEEQRQGKPGTTCAYYVIADQPETVWEFCFRRDELVGSTPLGGRNAPGSPEQEGG